MTGMVISRMTEQAAPVTRITETRRRAAAAVIREAGDQGKGRASLDLGYAPTSRCRHSRRNRWPRPRWRSKEIRDFIAAIRASLPLYAVEQP